jgi:hypothetical protein
MPSRLGLVLLMAATLAFPVVASAAEPGPPVPEAVTLPTKIVAGQSTVGTVCLDRVPEEPTEVLLRSDNTFVAEVPNSVIISPPDQCADFTVTTFDRGFAREISIVVSAHANGDFAQTVLAVIPFEGYDLVEIIKADVNKNFGHVTIVATSDEPNAVLTAFFGEQELGVLTQKGDRYVGRFDLNGQQINHVMVHSSAGGCAQRAVPFGNSSTHC